MLTRTGLLIALALAAMFLAGCSSSDQETIDKAVSATLAAGQPQERSSVSNNTSKVAEDSNDKDNQKTKASEKNSSPKKTRLEIAIGDVDPPECDRIRLSGPITLSDAAQYDCAATALALIEPAGSIPGVDVNAPDDDGKTVLIIAAEHNSVNVARILIENGAEEQFDSLITAIHNNSFDVIRLLIENGIDPNDQQTSYLWSSVVASGSTELTSLWIDLGADVNMRDSDGNTVLWITMSRAPEIAKLEIAKLLIKHGADVNAKSKQLLTPLHYAASGDIAMTKMLLEAGADVNAKADERSQNQRTPLISAIVNNSTEIATLLIEAGAEINLKNADGRTPLWFALKTCYPIDRRGIHPEAYTCSGERGAVVRILLTNGADWEPRYGHERD